VERDRPKRAARRHGAKSFLNRTAVRAGGVVLVVLGIAVHGGRATGHECLPAPPTLAPPWSPPDRSATDLHRHRCGLALVVPNPAAAAMLTAFLTVLQIQVRLVEEPYLPRVDGSAWERYAAGRDASSLGSGGTAQHGVGLGTEQEIHACRESDS
jgi:hypothetical protein